MSYGEINEDSLKWYVGDLDRRVSRVEELKPDVMAYELKEVRKDLISMKRAFYTFSFSIVGSAIMFAFTVFALLGHHHP